MTFQNEDSEEDIETLDKESNVNDAYIDDLLRETPKAHDEDTLL